MLSTNSDLAFRVVGGRTGAFLGLAGGARGLGPARAEERAEGAGDTGRLLGPATGSAAEAAAFFAVALGAVVFEREEAGASADAVVFVVWGALALE